MLAKKNWNPQNYNHLLNKTPKGNVTNYKEYRSKYDILGDYIGKDPYIYGQDHLDYPEVEILNNRIPQEIREIIKTCNQQKDNRTDLQYAKGVVQNWILEINNQERMRKFGLEVERNGIDKDLKFVPGHEISSASDFIINNQEFEQVADYKGYWIENGILHLRCYKYNNIIKNGAEILATDTINHMSAIIEPKKVKTIYIPHHKPWGKPATALIIPDVHWFPKEDMDLDFYYFRKNYFFN